MPLVDLLQRQPALFLHRVDGPEVAGAEDDDVPVGDVILRPLSLAAGSLAERMADHLLLLVTVRDLGDAPAGECALDEIAERDPVSLLERCALRLSVIREH